MGRQAPFEAILFQFALTEADVIALMRKSLHQGLCALQQAIHLEKKMGKGLVEVKYCSENAERRVDFSLIR